MSVTTIRTLHCNTCTNWTGGVDPLDNATQIRRWAKRHGWKVALPGGEDICPDCVAAGRTEVPPR